MTGTENKTQAPGKRGNVCRMTKEDALDVLVSRVLLKWPGADDGTERAALAHRSRAELIHSVGAQAYGNLAEYDDVVCKYAYGIMSPDEKRKIDKGG